MCMCKPCPNVLEDALTWCSMFYKLNPWSERALHEASHPAFLPVDSGCQDVHVVMVI